MSQNSLSNYLERFGAKHCDGDTLASVVPPAYSAILDENTVEKWLGLTNPELKALIKARHIIPLGKPRPKTQKPFAAVYILELRKDREWLSAARDIITNHWRKMNAGRKKKHATQIG